MLLAESTYTAGYVSYFQCIEGGVELGDTLSKSRVVDDGIGT